MFVRAPLLLFFAAVYLATMAAIATAFTTISPPETKSFLSSSGASKSSSVLSDNAVGWSSANGLAVGVKNPEGLFTTTHLPFCLLPNAIPRPTFDYATRVAPLFNDLVDAISRDGAWLEEVLADVVEDDPFTAKLLEIFRESQRAPSKQELCLGIQRSDYMLDVGPDGANLMQIELNTIASSFGSMGSLTSKLHKHLIGRFAGDAKDDEDASEGEDPSVASVLRSHLRHCGVVTKGKSDRFLSSLVPDNPTLICLPGAIAKAHEVFGDKKAVVVFVVQPGETNSVDQRLLEMALWEKHSVKVRRMTLAEINTEGQINAEGALQVPIDSSSSSIHNMATVSVAYFRAGYTPNDYPSGETGVEWKGRILIESSNAVKCPNIGYHLAGTKKVQQVLCEPGQVERFLKPDAAKELRKCFAGLWPAAPLPTDTGAVEAVNKAIQDPTGYVLKPQREGGGNNVYGSAISKRLKDGVVGGEDGLRSYILMQRLFPEPQEAALIGRGQMKTGKTLSEWGFFGVYLGRGGGAAPLLNEYAGHIVRTKLDGVDEGGVATGYSFLSSPILIGDDEIETMHDL